MDFGIQITELAIIIYKQLYIYGVHQLIGILHVRSEYTWKIQTTSISLAPSLISHIFPSVRRDTKYM